MIVVGLDPSLTGFGFARSGGGGPALTTVSTSPRIQMEHRMRDLLSHVKDAVAGADIVTMEGLAFGAKGSAVTDLAGLHWLIRCYLANHLIPFAVADPSTRMKWLTGNGNASKDTCLAQVIRRWPGVPIGNNNEADAWTLVAMTYAAYGHPVTKMPAGRDALLRAVNPKTGKPKIGWPELNGVPNA